MSTIVRATGSGPGASSSAGYPSVLNYGAKGDAATVNDAAFAAAISAAAAAGGGAVGGAVAVPPGIYMVSAPVLVKDKVRLVGASRSGTVIRATSGFVGDHVIRLGGGAGGGAIGFGMTVEWMTIDANDVVQKCVYTNEAQELSGVFSCVLTKFRGSGIYITNPSRLITVDGAEVYGSASGWTYGIEVNDATGPITIRRITVNSNGGASALGTAGLYVTSARVNVSHFHGERVNDSIVMDANAYGMLSAVDSTTDVSGKAVRITTASSGGVAILDASGINDQKTGKTAGYTQAYFIGSPNSTKAVWTLGDPTVVTRNQNRAQTEKPTTNVRNLLTNTTGTLAVDLSTSAHHQITLQANLTTLTFTNGEDGMEFLVRIVQDATGGRTVTWPAGVKWAGATAPTLTTTANRSDVFKFYSLNGSPVEISRSLNLP